MDSNGIEPLKHYLSEDGEWYIELSEEAINKVKEEFAKGTDRVNVLPLSTGRPNLKEWLEKQIKDCEADAGELLFECDSPVASAKKMTEARAYQNVLNYIANGKEA